MNKEEKEIITEAKKQAKLFQIDLTIRIGTEIIAHWIFPPNTMNKEIEIKHKENETRQMGKEMG